MKHHAFLIVGAACLVVGFSSYRLGRDRAISISEAAIHPALRATHATMAAVASRPPAELASLKKRLKHRYASCPSAEHDWILRGQTAALLDTMTAAELESLLAEILAFRDGRVAPWRLVLATDVLREWGKKDPVGACAAKAAPFLTDAGRMVAFRDWLLRDPAAVTRWMNSGDVVPTDLREAWLSERAKVDPLDAIQKLAGLAPKAREASLLEWSTSSALLPTERRLLLDAVGDDPELLRKCAERMAAALADRSVEEAYEFVDSLELDEESATALDDGIFAKWAVREPQVAFAAWAEQKETRVPDTFLRSLDSWSLNSPGTEEAIRWVDTIEAGPAKETIQLHFIKDLTSSGRFEQAVRMGLSMDNREEGKRQAMRVVARLKERSPEQARALASILREAGMEMP